MNGASERVNLEAKQKQLKALMVMMLIFMVAGPTLGPKIFADEFSQLRGVGLRIFYIGTPAVFGALFPFYLILYQRVAKKLKDVG